ncbi:serine/threonine-protein kinase SMG1 isoform X2 [Neocloeon triangulifer]|uniref:serine/threonine-protein kinase SMG1 isoform X2 n=1 Tax=Neocloeon triangulifer TaxID=2078957 RepID=UPI00286EC39F|nr:serine/threonine-protein kinase SMG1 isoform X2 [Neocloeon triangulifer]
MDADEPDAPISRPVKGVLEIPTMVIHNSSEESTKGQRSGHQRRESGWKSKSSEKRSTGGSRKIFKGESSSKSNKKDSHRTKEGILTSLLPEDCRISTLLRRMHHENNMEVFFSITATLKESLTSPDNNRYIRRALETITESLLDILQNGPSSDARSEGARCLGVAGYALDGDAKRFFDWIFTTFQREKRDDVRLLLIEALQHMLKLEKDHPKLNDLTEILLTQLHENLECTENSDIMWAILETILLVDKTYSKAIIKFFPDIVDILIGWHIDISQPDAVIKIASYGLKELNQYWILEIPFTLNLLSQFLEDMEAYREDLMLTVEGHSDPENTPEDFVQRIKLTIQVYNTVVQCLGQEAKPKEGSVITPAFWSDGMKRVIETVLCSTAHSAMQESVILAANETVLILLDLIGGLGWNTGLHSYIKKQLENIQTFATSTMISFCETVSKAVRECRVYLPIELIGELIGPQSPLLKLRESSEKQTTALIGVYHSLLSLKNIPLLQETYSLVLQDLEKAYKVLVPEVEPFVLGNVSNGFKDYTREEAEIVVLFLLNSLIDIARESSIIGMWALKPTIMELLSEHLVPHYKMLNTVSPAIQFTLLTIMNCHCTKYSNFMSSSILVKSGSQHFAQDSSSPSTGYFTLVLKILTETLSEENTVCQEVMLLCLHWSRELILQAKSCIEKLLTAHEFVDLLRVIIAAGATVQTEIAVAVAGCLNKLLEIHPLTGPLDNVLISIVKLCILHMNSVDPLVKACYHEVFLLCPWTCSLKEIEKLDKSLKSGTKQYGSTLVDRVSRIHHSRINIGELNSFQFSNLMSYLLQGSVHNNQWLVDTLNLSLISSPNNTNEEIEKVRIACSHSIKALWKWATWQAAQFTVNSKLRTPLGKPQDTFSAIENAIKGLAREFDCDKTTENFQSKTTIHDMTQARLLLDFLEQLEKSIYNASHGCSVAMPIAPKPVRLFFYTNRSVCAEWITRIRWATVMVAIHSGMPHVAVRQGLVLLSDLTSQQQISQVEVEKATILLTNSLLQLKEPEALQGLHRWCSDKTRLRFPWIKAATLQAAERFEDAIQEYSKKDALQENVPPHHHAINADQLCECLFSESNWSQLELVKEELGKYCGRYDTLISSSMTLETVKRLSNFEQLKYERAEKIDFDLRKPNKVLAQILEEFTTLSLELKESPTKKSSQMISLANQCNKALQSLLEESLRQNSDHICQDVLILQQVGQALSSYMKDPASQFYNPFLLDLENMSSQVLRKVLYWNKLFQAIRQDDDMSLTYLTASRLARKSGNYNRAKILLTDYWCTKKGSDVASFETLEPDFGVDFAAEKETAKLFYCINKRTEAIEILSKSTLEFAQIAVSDGSIEDKTAASELALTLAKKLAKFTSAEKQHNVQNLNSLMYLLQWADKRSVCMIALGIKVSDAIGDSFSRQLYQIALETCPTNAKAWCQFAAWSYRQGRKASDWEEDGSVLAMPSEADRQKLASILEVESNEFLVSSIMTILHERRKTELDDNQLGDILKSMLSSVEEVDKKVSQIVSFWSQSSKSHLFYQSAVTAYFNFLQLYSLDDKELAEAALTATLRLLRLIVKHATSFQEVLEKGLASTPTAPWKGIIPQLFSRLNHPEPFVRRRLSELLCRLASDAPHLILFPAVVGCSTASKGPQKNDNLMESFVQDEEDDIEDDEEEDEEPEDECQNSVLRSCFLAMVDTLSQQAPASINQVRLLVSELRRITVLWDELWLGCLSQHQQDVTRRLYQLETEQKKLEENSSLDEATKVRLMREKYNIVMKPVIIVLEQLAKLTSLPAETPHEKTFQTLHKENISKALEELKNPSLTEELKPEQCWQQFKALHAELLRQSQKKAYQNLKLSEISPQLASLKDSAITMPGLSQPMVTIAGIENSVSILPTKTRPKKLAMQGSDGKYYVYLFKGLEDLHLDERIMQFLSITNTMLQSKTGPNYHACFYSVVPLGNRSGLISWVDGVQPIFSLYKRWQMREAAAKQLRQQQISSSAPVVPRPSELFYSKLSPLLAEQNIPIENRKEWPHAMLRQVLVALMNETANDLLAKELWCTSTDSGNWWTVTKTYARSVAVMSVIGYIIGLGDRHLDNLLVNLTTGEIVHIDYNVCFEKGQTLRVPEKVPFRLTPNLQTALGVTGVEGIFRLSCEHVLRTMKYGRETLLTLLEAFVYDPLIDWTPDNEAGYTGAVFDGLSQRTEMEVHRPSRRELEREAALGMLSVRATEIKAPWGKNKVELLEARTHLSDKLHKWILICMEVQKIQNAVQEAHQQMSVLKEAAAVGPNHPIFTLHERNVNYMRVEGALANVEVQLRKTLEETKTNISRIQSAVIAIKTTGEVRLWANELQAINQIESQELFDLVREFLNSAGQSSILEQCERVERQYITIVQQMQNTLRGGLDLLGQFGIISSLLSPAQLQCQHTSLHAKIAEDLLQNLSAERCRVAMSQLNKHAMQVNLPPMEYLVNYQAQLQVATKHAAARLQKLYKKSEEEPRLQLAMMKEQLLQLTEENGKAVAIAVAQKLSALNTSILALEAAAANTGESLVDLTLREGEWFLDKMVQISGLSVELAQVLPMIQPHSDILGNAIACLVASNAVYRDLEELIWNTSSIIAPETVSALTTEEPSVIAAVVGLRDLIASAGRPLTDIAKELEVNLKYLALELPVPHPKSQEICSILRSNFSSLIHQDLSEHLSPGQKLLMGFSGLFERLQKDARKLMAALRIVNVPQSWLSFDQLNKARGLSWTVRREFSLSLVEDMFLVKMLQVMFDVFSLAQQSAHAFHGLQEIAVSNLISDENLIQPVKRYCADFIRLQLIGLQPEAVIVLVCTAVEEILGVNLTEMVEQKEVGAESRVSLEDIFASLATIESQRPLTLLGEMELGWRNKESFALVKKELNAAQAYYQQLQLKMTVHAWINDFPQTGRPVFVANLNKTLRNIIALQPGLIEVAEQHKSLVENIVQRLKWAAGANPTLAEVLAAFKNSSSGRTEKLLGLQVLSSKIVTACSGILHLESLRNNTQEALAVNTSLLQLLGKCEQNLVVVEAAGPYSLTSVEKNLAKLLVPNQSVDTAWLQSAEKQVSNQIINSTTQLMSEKTKQSAAFAEIKSTTAELRSVLTNHHSLMSSVRPLLRTLAKPGEGRETLGKYVGQYKNFSEEFSAVVQCLALDELDPNQGKALLHQLSALEKMIDDVYNGLMDIPALSQSEEHIRHSFVRQDSIANQETIPGTEKQKIPQERNAFAMGVLRRVKAKLEGRDLDPGKAMSVQEQVELIISESTSLDNLCQHYEGWTPWV